LDRLIVSIDGTTQESYESYRIGGRRKAKPIYETFPGWQTDVTKVRKLEDLPAAARKYLDRVSQLVGKPVEIVSVGPDRAQTMFTGSMQA
jgi:adenylosuccinate synthase